MRIAVVVLLSLIAGGCSRPADPAPAERRPLAPGEMRFALRGEVIKADPEEGTLRVQHEKIEGYMAAMTMDFHASKGDIATYGAGRRIRADLIVNLKHEHRLENIWPDDRAEADIVAAGAKALREDTL